METFHFKKEYRYFIYGASIRGKAARKALEGAGYHVEAFFDRNADSFSDIDGMKVYHPGRFEHGGFESAVVVVTITNSYEHPMIADYLYGLGYDKIVYLPFEGRLDTGVESDSFRSVYHRTLSGSIGEEDCFFKYAPALFDEQFQDGALIRESGGDVVAFLPIELCFAAAASGNGGESACSLGERVPLSIANGDCVRYFKAIYGTAGQVRMAADELVCRRLGAHGKYERIEESGTALLINRDAIFWRMFRAFQYSGMRYFIDRPIEVSWDGGVFFVRDGVQRVCFFLALGLSSIPARMTREDYVRWIHRDKLDACLAYIKEGRVAAAYAPIPHPNFRFFPAYRDIGGFTRLQKIGEVLAYNRVRVQDKKVLDAGSYYCYLSQFFARLGARVTAVEYEPSSSRFGALLNELLYCSGIRSVCCGLDRIDISQRFSFTIMLTVLYWYLDDPLGLEILRNVDAVTEDFLIWESGDRLEEEIRFILEHSSFRTYLRLGETFGTGKIREMGIFCKEHVELRLPEWLDRR